MVVRPAVWLDFDSMSGRVVLVKLVVTEVVLE